MKNTFLKCGRFVLMVIVVINFAVAIFIKAQGDSFDLIQQTKQLYSENRRDVALVLIKIFKGNNNWGNDELVKIEKQLEYSTFEMFKSALWNGVTKGEVCDHYSGLGAITADMCLWGDIRDLVIDGYKIIYMDRDVELISVLEIALGVRGQFFGEGFGGSIGARE